MMAFSDRRARIFQTQSPQRLDNNRYEHMNSLNDLWMMRLKAIEAEYYSIKN